MKQIYSQTRVELSKERESQTNIIKEYWFKNFKENIGEKKRL